mmetsp:Transcript_16679/g.16775  ORF Transcript_16679/g.16775 Transcript_16679/m.16775 type:complete len:265 (-) Transcript_16679:78-872(-)
MSKSAVESAAHAFFKKKSTAAYTLTDVILGQPSEEQIAEWDRKFESCNLWEISNRMRNGVKVRDRMYHFKVYSKCFVGSEAAKWMVKEGLVESISEAEYLGSLLVNAGLIHHYCDDHDFRAQFLFYCFAMDSSTKTDYDDMKLDELEMTFRKVVVVSDRKHHLKTYHSVFVGEEAVDALVESGQCQNRGEAIKIGSLFLNSGMFSHVSGTHDFEDDFLFYRFTDSNGWNTTDTDEPTSLRSNGTLSIMGLSGRGRSKKLTLLAD